MYVSRRSEICDGIICHGCKSPILMNLLTLRVIVSNAYSALHYYDCGYNYILKSIVDRQLSISLVY